MPRDQEAQREVQELDAERTVEGNEGVVRDFDWFCALESCSNECCCSRLLECAYWREKALRELLEIAEKHSGKQGLVRF